MIFASNTFLLTTAIGLLTIATALFIWVILEELKDEADILFIFLGLIAISIIFLLPLVIGLIQNL